MRLRRLAWRAQCCPLSTRCRERFQLRAVPAVKAERPACNSDAKSGAVRLPSSAPGPPHDLPEAAAREPRHISPPKIALQTIVYRLQCLTMKIAIKTSYIPHMIVCILQIIVKMMIFYFTNVMKSR